MRYTVQTRYPGESFWRDIVTVNSEKQALDYCALSSSNQQGDFRAVAIVSRIYNGDNA